MTSDVRYDIGKVALGAALIRYDIVDMISKAGSGHPGGSLSSADILAVLYLSGVMSYDPENLDDPARDRFVLSKGHAAPVLYASLAQAGIIERDELSTLRKLNSRLQGHPDCRKLPGVEVSTGSLGQGLSVAAGMALGIRMSVLGAKAGAGVCDDVIGSESGTIPTVFALMGDGESQEGQIWEAAEFASHYRLSNLVGILDYNDLQIDGRCSDVMGISPVEDRWASFGWGIISVDGHDISQIHAALVDAKRRHEGPTMVIARTVKGKGVSFMENQVSWHGKAPDAEQTEKALAELSGAIEAARMKIGGSDGR